MRRSAILVATLVVVAAFLVRASLSITTWLGLNGWAIWIALTAIFVLGMRVTTYRNAKIVVMIAALVVAVVCSVYAEPIGISGTIMVPLTLGALLFAGVRRQVPVAEG